MKNLPQRLRGLKQKAFFALIALIAVSFIVHFYVYISPSIRDALPAKLILSGEWDLCLPATRSAQGCSWTKESVPSEKTKRSLDQFAGWMIYRKSFTAPESCLSQDEPCALFMGEVDDAVEAKLNGIAIGMRGGFPPHVFYSKHYPAKFDLSGDLLKRGNQANELVLTVYSLKKTQAGIRRGPVGIYSELNAFKLSQSFVAMTVFVPIIGFVGLFLLALFTSFFNLNKATDDAKLQTYVSYCFVNAIFLLSFSELPREYLPIWLAGYLHFVFRFLSSWTYFEMIREYYRFGPWSKKYVRPLYALAFAVYVGIFMVQYFSGSINNGGAGFDVALLTLQKAVPLLWAPHFFGIAGAWRTRGTRAGKFFLAFFSAILVCQIHDTLIFHGYTSGTYAVKIYPLIVGLCFGSVLWIEQQRERERLIVARQNALHAAQVAHDIGSPLAALRVAMTDLTGIPEENRLILRTAVGRIQDIANSLLEKYRRRSPARSGSDATKAQASLLSSLVDPVVTEKRLKFRSRAGIEIDACFDAASYGLFVDVQPREFKRALSNLIDNAVEALEDDRGMVRVALEARGNQAVVSVRDDGKGIPPDILAALGQLGVSHGKAGGSGLGLHHARTWAETCGGGLAIVSRPGEGTVASLHLPQAPAPSWFVSELHLPAGRAVVILDDDASIHQVWRRRLSELSRHGTAFETVNLFTPSEMRAWVRGNIQKSREAVYLLDYELIGHADTGLSLAKEFGIGEQAVLVTSRYDEPEILNLCRALKARMIPKGLAAFVPLRLASPSSEHSERWDAVLIDDDPLIRKIWRISAERANKTLRTFDTFEKFVQVAEGIDRGTPIFVDEELSDNQSGAQASRRIHQMGFGEIYLTTGHAPAVFSGHGHLRAVVGKDAPWTVAGDLAQPQGVRSKA